MGSRLNVGFRPRRGYMSRGSKRLGPGKRTREREKVRRQLKCKFVGMGVTTCELRLPGCMVDDGLGFAHALKRRHITTDEDMRRVALLCNSCHDVLELQGEAKMSRIIDSIISRRAVG